jgi:GntR family transcriptional regulator, galactonate operon transcriptional repressor
MSQLKSSLHNQVAEILARRIMRGELKPGNRLPDIVQLRSEFQVSRTVLREAVKLLTAKGLVESKPRVGMTVCPRRQWSMLDPEVLLWRVEAGIDKDFFRELIDMRCVIEPGSAEFASLYATPQELKQIEAAYLRLESSVNDADVFVRADIQFHQTILASTHNELLQQMSQIIGVAIMAIARATATVPGSSEASLRIHHGVMDAILSREPALARQRMRQLVDEASYEIDRFLQQIENQPEHQKLLSQTSQQVHEYLTLEMI